MAIDTFKTTRGIKISTLSDTSFILFNVPKFINKSNLEKSIKTKLNNSSNESNVQKYKKHFYNPATLDWYVQVPRHLTKSFLDGNKIKLSIGSFPARLNLNPSRCSNCQLYGHFSIKCLKRRSASSVQNRNTLEFLADLL